MLSTITVTWSFLFHILIQDLRRHREWNLLHSHGKMEITFWYSILGRKLLCQKQFLMQYFTPSIWSMIAKTFFSSLLFWFAEEARHSLHRHLNISAKIPEKWIMSTQWREWSCSLSLPTLCKSQNRRTLFFDFSKLSNIRYLDRNILILLFKYHACSKKIHYHYLDNNAGMQIFLESHTF